MSVDGQRVVACTPFGREETVSVLLPYMVRDHERGVLDEWQLWWNTDRHQSADRTYGMKLVEKYPFIVRKDPPPNRVRRLKWAKQYNTRTFFTYCTEPDTTYVRFDDDIVYVHEDAIETLVSTRLENTAPFVAFPIIWNNAISSWYLQMQGSIPREWGEVKPYCMDPIGWADPVFAERIHNLLLDNIAAGTVDDLFLYHDVQLPEGQQFSVSCFAYPSSEYHEHCEPPGFIEGTDDEHWHSVKMPQKLHRPNIIVGRSLVSHYTFYPQREHIQKTNILDRYRDAAKAL